MQMDNSIRKNDFQAAHIELDVFTTLTPYKTRHSDNKIPSE